MSNVNKFKNSESSESMFIFFSASRGCLSWKNLFEPKLLQINQIYYWRLDNKTHNYYNFLHSILKENVSTKIIKNAKQQGSGCEFLSSIK
jgi:hypothetical protein